MISTQCNASEPDETVMQTAPSLPTLRPGRKAHAACQGAPRRFARAGFRIGLMALLLAGGTWRAAAQDVISSEALQEFPAAALWNSTITAQPGDGEVVELNPPVFSWCYTADPRDCRYTDRHIREFQFQCAYDREFRTLVVDVRTPWNTFNMIPPFTQSPVYWRVAYRKAGDETIDGWSEVRKFEIASDATIWDRSLYTNEVYLAQKGAHPHMLFSADNKDEAATWLAANGGTSWQSLKNAAQAAIASDWWNQEHPTNTDHRTWIGGITKVAFVWQMTGDATLAAARPQDAADRYMTWFKGVGAYEKDVISGIVVDTLCTPPTLGVGAGSVGKLGYVYDWLYELMDASQRANCLDTIEKRCEHVLKNYSWHTNLGEVRSHSLAKFGHSHLAENLPSTLVSSLAAFNDSSIVRRFFEMGVNYQIAKQYYAGSQGMRVGRSYSFGDYFQQGIAATGMQLSMIFPECKEWLNPRYKDVLDWCEFMYPVGYSFGNEPWGDVGWGRISLLSSREYADFARFLGSGVAYQHVQNELATLGRTLAPPDFYNILVPFYWPEPTRVDNEQRSLFQPQDGWVMGVSKPSNTYGSFKDGVGMIFAARPQANGGCVGHSFFCDGSFQMWAYGAAITDAGASYSRYSRAPESHYSLLVDGLGQVQRQYAVDEPYYARVFAYSNAADFVYAAAELKPAYPTKPFTPTGELMPSIPWTYRHTGAPLHDLQNVERHVIFARRKYMVIYDRLSRTTPSTYSWIYHVMEPTLQLEGSSFSYTCKSQIAGGDDVRVLVAHIARPTELDVINLTGTNVTLNPIANDNYWTGRGPHTRAHALWISNKSPATNWHFLSVVYPVKPGDPDPQITRLDDYTVVVKSGAERDVISFDPLTAAANGATMVIDLPALQPIPVDTGLVAANLAPVVTAGDDQTINFAQTDTARLSGSVSDDGLPEESNVTATWFKLSGSGTATFGNTSSSETTVAFSAPGTYVLSLFANDGELTASDKVVITVSQDSGTRPVPPPGHRLAP